MAVAFSGCGAFSGAISASGICWGAFASPFFWTSVTIVGRKSTLTLFSPLKVFIPPMVFSYLLDLLARCAFLIDLLGEAGVYDGRLFGYGMRFWG